MPDSFTGLLAACRAVAPDSTDPRVIADALWLATARSADETASETSDAPPTDPEEEGSSPPVDNGGAVEHDNPVTGGSGMPSSVVSETHPDGSARIRGVPLSLGRADPLPGAVAVSRALQPLRRPWLHGTAQQLDIDATVEHYARGGPLVPVFGSAPERWFEAVLVVDGSLSMAVWEETADALTGVLEGLGAFRSVRKWRLAWESGQPRLIDHQEREVHPDRVPHSGGGAHGRRLVVVVSDCVAQGWLRPGPWQFLADWGRKVPVLLVNPLPQRLWRRSALNLPAVRVTAGRPGDCNASLRFRPPARLRRRISHEDTSRWQALPVAACTPHALGSWGRTLMRADPRGCDAVLIPPSGRLPQPGGRTAVQSDPAALADAFLRTAPAAAVRLAVLCSQFPEITIPLLHVLRDRSVPEAQISDIAEVLTSGLFTVTRRPGHDPFMSWRPPASATLQAHLTTHDAWQTLRSLDQHLAVHLDSPRGLAAVLHDPRAPESLPAALQPFARASAATLRLLGISSTDVAAAADQPPGRQADRLEGEAEGGIPAGATGLDPADPGQPPTDEPAELPIPGRRRPAYRLVHLTPFADNTSRPGASPLPSTPARLLHPRYGAVPFTGRLAEMAMLSEWRQGAPETAMSVLLINAPGGYGKSRLAVEFARDSEASGWTVRQAFEPDATGTADGTADPTPADQLLVILDNADAWPAQTLNLLLHHLRSGRHGSRVRTLLLARAKDPWWQRLSDEASGLLGVPVTTHALKPLANTPEQQLALFREATESLARILDLHPSEIATLPAPRDLGHSPAYLRVSTIHTAALAAVLAFVRNDVRPADALKASIYVRQAEWRPRRWFDSQTVLVFQSAKQLFAGSRLGPVGTGILLGPRLVLTTSRRVPEGDSRVIRVTAKRGVLTAGDWIDCRVLWAHRDLGAALLQTDTDVHPDPAGPPQPWTDSSVRPRWAETWGRQALPCEIFPITRVRTASQHPLIGTVHPARTGHRLDLSADLGRREFWEPFVLGAPVCHGALLTGIVTGREPSGFTVTTMSELARDPGFDAIVKRHMPPPLLVDPLSEATTSPTSLPPGAVEQADPPGDLEPTAAAEVAVRWQHAYRRDGSRNDWFDVVALRDDRAVLIIGTAVDLPSSRSATARQLRAYVKGLAGLGVRPRAVIQRLLRQAHLFEDVMATLAIAAYDPDAATLTIATAGHEPPVLVDGRGRPKVLGPPDNVGSVGAGAEGPVDEMEVPAPPGTTLLMFTDGFLRDARHHTSDARGELVRHVRAAVGAGPQPPLHDLCDRLVEISGEDWRDGDAILLAARFGAPEPLQDTASDQATPRLPEVKPGAQEDVAPSQDPPPAVPNLLDVANRWRNAPPSQRLRGRQVLRDVVDALEQRPTDAERRGALATARDLAESLTRDSRFARGTALANALAVGAKQATALLSAFRKPDPATEQEALGPILVAASFSLALDFALMISAARHNERGRDLAQASDLANTLAVVLSGASVLPPAEEQLACRLLQEAADDFTAADLRRAELAKAELVAIRWDEETRWPNARWASLIQAASRETAPGSGVYVVTSVPGGEQTDPSG
ncbi:PP2C family protein-serine/threonine phosphatase [Actinacidiphila epipremni]|uniref:Serine/threonine-protein phosphatase n=1 Tax=Actinacidiphila epipremni TaxID=2053013 RepID=A0ABX0ZV09_9ACTN|nr:PP2C family protein-serine/threonine phosphatase [Actinacidiphila epipremni]NJP46482.1 serine/threonine-protein phosphatase [Actinacidiphila epipremni]